MLAVYDSKTGFYINNRNKTIIIDLIYHGGKERVVADLDDYDKLLQYTYSITTNKQGKKYVATNKNLSLHEIIMGRKAGPGYKIDHINSNGLDNRKINLRIATNSENGHNKVKLKNTASKYIGVSIKHYKWFSQIVKDGKRYHIGVYENEIDAAKAYDVWALYLYGNLANTNTRRLNIPVVTDEEKKWILDNNKVLPGYEKKNRKTFSKDLPDNIYRYSDNENKFMYGIVINGVTYQKYSFNSVEEAKLALDCLLEEKKKESDEREIERRKNIIRNKEGIAVIDIKNNKGEKLFEVLLDDNIWQDLSKYSWSRANDQYAQASIDGKMARMHIYVFETYMKKGKVSSGCNVDHIYSERPFDNRMSNLRENTPRGQAHNKSKRTGSLNKYVGVTISKGKFRVFIDKKTYGYFETEEEGALKYNEIVSQLYGDKARLNVITTVGTRTEDYFKNISLEFAQSIEKCNILRELFRIREDWRKTYKVVLSKINKKTFDYHKNLLIDIVTKESL